ncbi:hypothetical protein [Anaerococcus vaginalis]|uniref:hypothetical protein n=1 Tax=Anaerococcus vaginalis TaxID=33037 RepID=UPI00291155FB|nr:hypothetical protein [Anaerococcus vaginalis]MDU5252682.1 hypothetical protein [Anaerococcus vaginalis]MDU6781439.1 hypothetical protein [Anaerococcus vaginalis]
MKIKLFYDDEYIEGKSDYSCLGVTVDSWKNFWDLWTDSSEFIRCDDTCNKKRNYLRKDRVIQIMED